MKYFISLIFYSKACQEVPEWLEQAALQATGTGYGINQKGSYRDQRGNQRNGGSGGNNFSNGGMRSPPVQNGGQRTIVAADDDDGEEW